MKTEKEWEWLRDRVAYIKGLKSPNDQQALLVLLAEKPDRNAQDEKKLAALVRAEKAAIRAAKARQAATHLIHEEKRAAKEAERKARNHRLVTQGLLFDLAGLGNRSKGELLGLLIAAAATTDEQRWATWKQRGDALLVQKAREVSEVEKGVAKSK
jgi:hypothetical protein